MVFMTTKVNRRLKRKGNTHQWGNFGFFSLDAKLYERGGFPIKVEYHGKQSQTT